MTTPAPITITQNADGSYDIPGFHLVPYEAPPSPPPPPAPPPSPPPTPPPAPPAAADYAGALEEGQTFDPPVGA